ncbi:hypothetical protein [Streptomyces sp. NRRL S-813]|uniref:hypothetical protein n=1 Tax=Streptomyces sp. NRRL S-813 TaxID=1463919 RepID=UPI00131C70BB|nr:hypothetical protein [Streptomyces sp. NRRL S-813]
MSALTHPTQWDLPPVGAVVVGAAGQPTFLPGGAGLICLKRTGIGEPPSDPERFTDADRRALSPLFWTHVNPYGRFELDMNSHLNLDLSLRGTVPGPRIPHDEAAATPA